MKISEAFPANDEEKKRFYDDLDLLCPIDLGEGHWVGWKENGDLWEVHECKRGPSIGTIDLTSGSHHKLISKEPLHIEASVGCHQCPSHGWIREGKWTNVG